MDSNNLFIGLRNDELVDYGLSKRFEHRKEKDSIDGMLRTQQIHGMHIQGW